MENQEQTNPPKPKTLKEQTREMIAAAAKKNGGKLASPRGQGPYDARRFRHL
jgi:hypothetical protein